LLQHFFESASIPETVYISATFSGIIYVFGIGSGFGYGTVSDSGSRTVSDSDSITISVFVSRTVSVSVTFFVAATVSDSQSVSFLKLFPVLQL
jgi:hypothetical protein